MKLGTKRMPLGRLVLMTFGKRAPATCTVSYLDGDRSNCRLGNLIWTLRPSRRGKRSRVRF